MSGYLQGSMFAQDERNPLALMANALGEDSSSAAPAPQSWYGGINQKINQGGDWINQHRKPLMQLADVANIIGGWSNKSGRGFELAKYLNRGIAGSELQKTVSPQEAAPQATPPGRLVSEKTIVERKYDVNQNGIDDRLEGGRMARQPMLGSVGQGLANFPVGASEQPGTAAPAVRPQPQAPIAAAQALAGQPIQPEPVVPQSQQFAPVGDMEFLARTQGISTVMDALKTREANRLGWDTGDTNRFKVQTDRMQLPIQQTTADAAMLKARTDASELPIKIANTGSEIERRRHQNLKDLSDIAKNEYERSPAYVKLKGDIKAAEAAGDAAAKAAAVEQAAKIADGIPVLEPTLKKLFPTYGALMRATGTISTAPLDAAIAATQSGVSAGIAADAVAKGAVASLAASLNTALEPFDKLVDPITDPKDSGYTLQKFMVDAGKVKLNTPENVAYKKRLTDMRDNAFQVLGMKGGLGKADERRHITPKQEAIQIRVNGKLMDAKKISETQAIGADGKTYNLTPLKK